MDAIQMTIPERIAMAIAMLECERSRAHARNDRSAYFTIVGTIRLLVDIQTDRPNSEASQEGKFLARKLAENEHDRTGEPVATIMARRGTQTVQPDEN